MRRLQCPCRAHDRGRQLNWFRLVLFRLPFPSVPFLLVSKNEHLMAPTVLLKHFSTSRTLTYCGALTFLSAPGVDCLRPDSAHEVLQPGWLLRAFCFPFQVRKAVRAARDSQLQRARHVSSGLYRSATSSNRSVRPYRLNRSADGSATSVALR